MSAEGNVVQPRVDEGGKEGHGDIVVEGATPMEVDIAQVVEKVVSPESRQSNEEVTGVSNLEGETPMCDVSEGRTTVGGQEGETPVKNVEGETPIDFEEEIPHEKEEEVADGDGVGDEPEKLIVDLVGESADDEMPVDDRTTRRATRRSRMLEELEETPRSRRLEFGETEADISRAEGEQWGAKDFSRAEEQRLAAERKRKGKLKAKAPSKKHKPVSSTLEIQEPVPEKIRVPFAKEFQGLEAESETEIEEGSDQEEKPAYEKTEVWVTKKLLEAMAEFEDPKRVQAYKERGGSGKLVKSGKSYDPEAIQDIESEEEFLGYIGI